MAANEDKQRGGYDCKFVITPPGALMCQLCQLVAREPQLSVCCGNNFCKSCLETRKSEESCPACTDNDCFFTTFPNKLSDREVKKLLILCKNNEKGCGWRDELVNLEDHLNICEFEEIECHQKCGMMIERPKMDDHVINGCPNRQVECEYCQTKGEYHVIMEQHKDECSKRPLSCPNECGLENIGKDELEWHLRKCPLQKIHCKYHNIGCEAKILNGAQDEHDEACMKEHFHLMRNELAHTTEELVDLKLKVGEREYYASWALKHKLLQGNENDINEDQVIIKKEHVEYKKEHAVVQENHIDGEETQSQLEVVTNELHTTQKEFAQWKKQSNFMLHQILGTFEWRVRLELLSKMMDNPDLGEVVAPVMIKVTEVEIKKEFKMVYKSPAFFTHPHGHKVCLCILPGGQGGQVTNFSVNIMNLSMNSKELGGTFTVSLMNQLEDIEHCSTKLKYEKDKESRSSVDGRV